MARQGIGTAGGAAPNASQRKGDTLVRHHTAFLKQFLRRPQSVGAVAPSSRHLARALCAPYENAVGPSRVLEVGAGTGAITRYLGTVLRPTDELDICELSSEFADILRRDVLASESLANAVAEERVRLLVGPVQDVVGDRRYDFVISGLPLTSFTIDQVKAVLHRIREVLKPGGVFSYFEYIGLRWLSSYIMMGSEGRRAREVSAFMSDNIRTYQTARQPILRNVPPAFARHWQFDRPLVP